MNALMRLARYAVLGVDTVKVNSMYEEIGTGHTYDNSGTSHTRYIEYGANRIDERRLKGKELIAYMQAKTIEYEHDESHHDSGNLVRLERRVTQNVEGSGENVRGLIGVDPWSQYL